MNEVLLYVLIILAGAVMLLLFWRRGELEGSGVEPMAMALPAPAVVNRVFSQEDFCYAQSLPKSIYRLFARDRKAMAMTWIRQLRYTGVLLMRRHVKTVRRSPALQFWKEARIAASLAAILVTCELFALAVVTLGPARLKLLITFLMVRMQALQMELEHPSLAAVRESA